MMKEPTETDLSSWEDMDSASASRDLAWNQPRPSACIVWSVCKAPISEIRTYSWCLTGFWEPVLHAVLPYPLLMQGEEFGPTSTSMLCPSHGRPAPF